MRNLRHVFDVCAAYCFESFSDAIGKRQDTSWMFATANAPVSFALGGRRCVREKTAGISMCLVPDDARPLGT